MSKVPFSMQCVLQRCGPLIEILVVSGRDSKNGVGLMDNTKEMNQQFTAELWTHAEDALDAAPRDRTVIHRRFPELIRIESENESSLLCRAPYRFALKFIRQFTIK